MSDPNTMAAFVGRMKVEELARFTGLGIEELVAVVLGHPPTKPIDRSVARARTSTRTAGNGARARRGQLSPLGAAVTIGAVPLPALGELVGRATYRQVHRAVDRWLLGSVWTQEDRNVTRAAQRLAISRRRFRDVFARATGDDVERDGAGERVLPLGPRAGQPATLPALEPLLATGTYREVHDEVDRWLFVHVLEWTQGNLSHAARHLDVSRKHLREHMARVGMR